MMRRKIELKTREETLQKYYPRSPVFSLSFLKSLFILFHLCQSRRLVSKLISVIEKR